MDERRFVLAHVHAEQPLPVRCRDSGEPKTGHGLRSVALVDDDVVGQQARGHVVEADVVLPASHMLDQVEVVAAIAHRVELEVTGQVDLPPDGVREGVDQNHVACLRHLAGGLIEPLDHEPSPVR